MRSKVLLLLVISLSILGIGFVVANHTAQWSCAASYTGWWANGACSPTIDDGGCQVTGSNTLASKLYFGSCGTGWTGQKLWQAQQRYNGDLVGNGCYIDYANAFVVEDGCVAQATCGNGVKEGSEACDSGSSNGQACTPSYGGNCQYCSSSCEYATAQGGVCGNSITESPEACDDGNTVDTDSCKNDCSGTGIPNCGNGAINTGEDCDGSNLNGKTCSNYVSGSTFTGGSLSCSNSCTFVTTACTSPSCGNGKIDGTDQCDGTNISSSSTCQAGGYMSGTIGCYSNCQLSYDSCTPYPPSQTCGNGVREGSEVCDNGGSNGACPATCSTSCTSNNCAPGICTLTSAAWSTFNTKEGNIVSLLVGGTNCAGQTVSFVVWEDDTTSTDDPVQTNPVNVVFSGNTATGSWTTEYQYDGALGDNPEYYFTATVAGIGSISSSTSLAQELTVTEANELICSQATKCGDYTTLETCTLDQCNVVQNTVPSGVECGTFGTICHCSWDSQTGVCKANVDGPAGLCTFTQSSADTCSDGFLTFSWTAVWAFAPGKTSADDTTGLQAKCVDGSKTVECPAQVALPFFNVYNIAIAVVLIGLIYWVISVKSSGKSKRKKL